MSDSEKVEEISTIVRPTEHLVALSEPPDDIGEDVSEEPIRGIETPSADRREVLDLAAQWRDKPSHLDRTRATLAYAFFGLFAFEVAAALAVAAFSPASGPVLLQVLDKVIAATAGLAGAASAFYYAQRRD